MTNIGAEKPEDYGLYFWWGDTVGYRREGNAWVASDGSSRNFEFSGDNAPTWGKDIGTLQSEGWITSSGVLAPEHDAAHIHWGGNWRMPTRVELFALNSNCDWTWTSRNGVNGYVVRGRGDYSEASIFLPAAGYGYVASLFSAGSDATTGRPSRTRAATATRGTSSSIRAATTRTSTSATNGCLSVLSRAAEAASTGSRWASEGTRTIG